MGRIALRLVNHAVQLHHVLQAIGQPGRSRFTIAPCPSGFLVIPLYRFGQVDVGHKTHIRFIDTHAKRNGRHHDHPFFSKKAGLVDGALLRIQPRMVGQGMDTVLAQKLGRIFHARARQAIHNPRIARVFFLNEAQKLLAHLVLFDNAIANIGAIKTGDKMPGLFQLQALGNFYPRQLSGSCRQGNPWHTRPALSQQIQAQILRAEVVAPL